MRYLTLVTFLFFLQNTIIYGQKSIILKGKLIEQTTNQPVEFATISIFSKEDNSLITGGLSELEGIFEFEIKNMPSYALIEFLSYTSKRVDLDIKSDTRILDLGIIQMATSSVAIDEVTVTAEKST
ncbi:MAG TPA: hypothetical protein PKD85_16020, partial [Saprospiraceae bacterium]|nr:hypothetical protein [Saprospiraceae bacterium]